METANCWLKLNKLGTNTPLRGVTPPEVVLLREMHEHNAGDNPIQGLTLVGETDEAWFLSITGDTGMSEEERTEWPGKWTNIQEHQRLLEKYKERNVHKVWPGKAVPQFPQTFSEAGFPPSALPAAKPSVEKPIQELVGHKLQPA